jgi:hypothetical protein
MKNLAKLGYGELSNYTKNGLLDTLSSNKNPKDPLGLLNWGFSKAVRVFNAPCALCNSTNNVQMHHIKALADVKKNKDKVSKHIISIKRKQIPLCRECHLKAHGGNWKNTPISVTK